MRTLQVSAALAVLVLSSTALAQTRLPGTLEAAVHAKILSFDRSLAGGSGPLVIGVVYDPSSALSKVSATKIVEGFGNLSKKRITVHSRHISVVRVPLSSDVEKALAKQRLHVLYAAADLEAVIPRIARSAAKHRIRTLSGDRAYVRAGLAVAVVEKNQRPGIVLKIANAKRCGMKLDPRLVRLAELIR